MGRKKKEPTKVIRVPLKHDARIRKFILDLESDIDAILNKKPKK